VKRHDFAKLAAGGCLAAVFTATVSGPLGFGLRYTDQLERRVRTSLDDRSLQHVDVAIEHRPALSRTILLTGSVPERDRRTAIDVARSIPGVADVRWTQKSAGPVGASSGYSVPYQ
jgi:hypothetical protein